MAWLHSAISFGPKVCVWLGPAADSVLKTLTIPIHFFRPISKRVAFVGFFHCSLLHNDSTTHAPMSNGAAMTPWVFPLTLLVPDWSGGVTNLTYQELCLHTGQDDKPFPKFSLTEAACPCMVICVTFSYN
jgi:hypothetical protein